LMQLQQRLASFGGNEAEAGENEAAGGNVYAARVEDADEDED
jgi:hypothetical protein